MDKLQRLYHYINVLSIDVALGAVVGSVFFARLLNVSIRPFGLAALGITVWIIYTVDHLHDARKIGTKASSTRHYFHQRYFKRLTIILMIAILLDIVLVFFIRKQVLQWGLILTLFVILYLIVQRNLYFAKEVFVAVMYTLGILLPSVSVTTMEISLYHYFLFIQFFLIALLNLIIFSWFDIEKDYSDNLVSFVTRFGKKSSTIFIQILFFIFFSINIVNGFVSDYNFYDVIFIMMGLVLLMIFIFPEFFSINNYYRICGDAVFFFPLCIWL